MTRTEYHRVDAPSLGGSGEIAVHGHWGRPVIWFPSEGGAPWDFEGNGVLDAVRPAIDDGRITVFCVPSFDADSWSASWMPTHRPRPQPPPLRGLDHLAGRAVHPVAVRRPRRRRAGRAVAGRVPRGAVRAPAPARVRPRGLAVRQLRPVVLARLGAGRRRDLLRLAVPVPAQHARRAPGLPALPRVPHAGRRQRHVGGLHRVQRSPPARWAPCSRRRASRTSCTCGVTSGRTTGRAGARRRPSTCPRSADAQASSQKVEQRAARASGASSAIW